MAEEAVLTHDDAGDKSSVTVESLAEEMGWTPLEKFKEKGGDESKWRSADAWIRSGERHNQSLRNEVRDLHKQIKVIAKTADRQVRREVEDRAKEIEARFTEAVKNNDKQGAAKAAQDMHALEAENTPHDYESDFAKRNPWYGKDEDASAYAVTIAQREAAKNKSPEEQLEAAEAAVKKRFPELFGDGKQDDDEPALKPQSKVAGRTDRTLTTRPKAKSFDDLPEAAKKGASRFWDAAKMRGTGKDEKAFKEQYARDYFASADE